MQNIITGLVILAVFVFAVYKTIKSKNSCPSCNSDCSCCCKNSDRQKNK